MHSSHCSDICQPSVQQMTASWQTNAKMSVTDHHKVKAVISYMTGAQNTDQ